MSSQQQNLPPECEESWFNDVIPCGKEFELPDISCQINTPFTDISENLPILQDQLLGSPTAPDNAFVSDISNPLGAKTEMASSPVMKMVRQIQFPRSAEIDDAFPVRNQRVQLPASDSDLPLRKQQFDIVNSTNSSNFNSISSHLENNPTLAFGSCETSRCGSNISITTDKQSSCISVPPNTLGFSSNDCNISNHGSFPSSGCTSAFGSRVSASIGKQKIESSGCPDLSSSGSNGSCARGNQLAYIPVMTNPPGFRSHRKTCPSHLQNSGRRTKIESNLSNPIRNQVADSNCGPLPNCSGSVRNQETLGPIPLQLGRAQINCDGNYTCKDKEKSISPSIEVKAIEKAIPSGDIRKKGRNKSSKRLSQEIFSPSNTVQRCKIPRIESSSRGEIKESE